MGRKIIAYDLGTGGNKASLYDADGTCLASVFVPYETCYPAEGWHEQRPLDWWAAVIESTRRLLKAATGEKGEVVCLALAGHSLGAVPMDAEGNLLREWTPIWSDTRAEQQAAAYFAKIEETQWYLTTGNGFPPACYPLFKVMWYRDNEPALFRRIRRIIGTKDFINYKLTGQIATDHSYASGSGVYDLRAQDYAAELIEASGLDGTLFPSPLPSTQILGTLTHEAADALDLPQTVQVVCGGVDNSCMAAGARGIAEGRIYTSLGSSAWIALTSAQPVLAASSRPFVFAHVVPGMYASATSIFAAGSALRWVRDNLCQNLVVEAQTTGRDAYELMTAAAAQSPVGANRLLFNPSLAGGNLLDPSPHLRGAYAGLDLRHTQADLIRAALEGIGLGLRIALDGLRSKGEICEAALGHEMLLVGGGSKSRLWRQIFADTFNMPILKTNIGQDAASLGAAALAAVGCGVWRDYGRIDEIHQTQELAQPIPENVAQYERLLLIYQYARDCGAKIGIMLKTL